MLARTVTRRGLVTLNRLVGLPSALILLSL